MATKIQSIQKNKTVDYSNELLQNFWRQKLNVSANQNHKNEIAKALQSAQEGIVCIQTEALTDKGLIKQIFDIAQNLKVRFYILVNEYSQELDLLNEICLIRYEIRNKGSFVLVNPNSDKPQGIFFTGQLTEQSIAVSQHISRSLDTKETKELFRHFCYQFWETAKKEVIEKGKKGDITSKPLDVFHDINAFGGKDFVYGTLFDFSEIAKRSELSDKQIISLNKETQIPIQIKANTTNDLGDIVLESLLPKSEFENKEPNFDDDGVSVSIEYKWQNTPFYLPEQANENALYERWKKKTEEIIKALDSIVNKIQEAEKKETNLSKAISRFFLGKKNVFGALKNEIDDLKQTDFANQAEAKLKEKINRINEINAQVQNEIGEIETEDRKAKLDEEIERLKSDISEKEGKNLDLLKLKQEKEAQKTEFERIKSEKTAELNSLKDAFEQEKQEKLNDFCAEHIINARDLNKFKAGLQQKARKNNKNLEEVESSKKILDKLNSIHNASISSESTSVLESSIRDCDEKVKSLFLSKIVDEISGVERQINAFKNQIESKEKEKNKQVSQSNLSSLSEIVGDKSSQQNNAGKSQFIQMPDLQQLPTIGKLFQVNSQQFLAIQNWEEYEQGKKEAERLKANLCAIKN
ncbi:MAG: hypothetical protein LC115_00235 [Bacteroidia bacterium]|nr:hypothetical protein [Bacteroidia bacterium]